MNSLTPGEETMIGALARQVQDGDWAACGTLSPMPAAALWLAQLSSLHPGVTLDAVRAATGFAFAAPAGIPETPPLDRTARGLLYGPVKEKLAVAYPQFAARL